MLPETSRPGVTPYHDRFSGLGCCVIIPTYNNDHALEDVIRGVQNFTSQVIVVNDGSTDGTREILARYPGLEVIHIAVNTGKGWALRQGFKHAISKGFRYAITIDSDGQHFAADLPLFLDLVEQEPDSMILGARDMTREGVPGTSSFGHRFSIFWFKVETGQAVPDVQTGYRLYPLRPLASIRRVVSRKYEYEVEILVRLAWSGVKILSVPVQVYYAPPETRVSHFRKFRDFTRVSIANSLLVFIALLWARPVAFFRNLRGKSLRQFFNEYLVNSADSDAKLAKSVALGLMVGVSPLWGWQILITLGLSHVLKLNKFVAVTASNISLPPMMPFVLFMSYFMGGWVLGGDTDGLTYHSEWTLRWVMENLWQYVLGSLLLGVSLALALGPVTYLLLRKFRRRNA